MRQVIQALIVILCVTAGLLLHGRNYQPVPFDYYVGVLQWPLSLLLVASLGVGVLLALLAGLPGRWRLRRRLRRAEIELARLAALPAKPSEASVADDA